MGADRPLTPAGLPDDTGQQAAGQQKTPGADDTRGFRPNHLMEDPMDQFGQLDLFPLSALQTRGYAQPEPRDDADTAAVEDPNQIAFDFGPAFEDAA